MTLRRIHLELARDHDFPLGSSKHGYDLVAPLDDDGHLIAAEWRSVREQCRVRRFWGDEAAEIGRVVHKPGGVWAFDYDPARADDDEPGFKLDKHRFLPGEYISITEHDGVRRTFRIVSVIEFDRQPVAHKVQGT